MPLPMPGSGGAYKARMRAIFDGADKRVMISFWLFGSCSPPRMPRRTVPEAMRSRSSDCRPTTTYRGRG